MRTNGRKDHDVAVFAARYEIKTTEELREELGSRRPSPWQRLAIRRVLRARGEEA